MARLPIMLALKRRMADHLAGITVAGGYFNDVQKVYRGRKVIGDEAPFPCLSIIEAGTPGTALWVGQDQDMGWSRKTLFVQGWAKDDQENPTDPADYLMCDVVERLSMVCQDGKQSFHPAHPEIYQFGEIISEMEIGPGVVVAPDGPAVTRAFFYLPVTVTMSIELDNFTIED